MHLISTVTLTRWITTAAKRYNGIMATGNITPGRHVEGRLELCHKQDVRARDVSTLHNIQTIWLLALCGLLLMTQAGYTAMLTLNLETIVRQADTIVLGTVTHQESAWDAHHTAIYTDVTVAVERAILGSPGDEVTLRIAGGIVGSMGMRTSNDPVLRDGERVIVCLDTTSVPARLIGMQQGVFSVRDNTVTSAGETLSLEDFIAAIRTVVR